MTVKIKTKTQKEMLQILLEELKTIKNQLQKLLILIPEESLKDYQNSDEIKKAYLKSLKKN